MFNPARALNLIEKRKGFIWSDKTCAATQQATILSSEAARVYTKLNYTISYLNPIRVLEIVVYTITCKNCDDVRVLLWINSWY